MFHAKWRGQTYILHRIFMEICSSSLCTDPSFPPRERGLYIGYAKENWSETDGIDYLSDVFTLLKFNTSCCTCHESCERALVLCPQKAQDESSNNFVARKIESLQRSQGNDWQIEHGRFWKSVFFPALNDRQNRFWKFDVNEKFLKPFIQR